MFYKIMSNSLLINLSFLTPEPTGIGTYAANLFLQLQQLEPTLLVSQQIENYTCYHIPETLAPNRGPKDKLTGCCGLSLSYQKFTKNCNPP